MHPSLHHMRQPAATGNYLGGGAEQLADLQAPLRVVLLHDGKAHLCPTPRPSNCRPAGFYFLGGGGRVGGKLVYLQFELFCSQLSFFAYIPFGCFPIVSKRAPNVSQKARIVRRKARSVSKRAPKQNYKQSVSKKLPIVRKEVASEAFLLSDFQ